ncbi:MAG: hypothetical protein HY077_12135 [Elusimicrobia bacterium]|nr:hypothetical protein [Elusimicrobiota bacterium]
MSRNLLLAFLFMAAAALVSAEDPGPIDPGPTESGVPGSRAAASSSLEWNAPDHKLFFNYQRYRAKIGLVCDTEKTWGPLSNDDKKKRLKDDEEFLQKKLADVLNQTWMSSEDEELITAVWGKKILGLVKTSQTEKKNGQQSKIDAAQKAVAEAAKRIGGIGGDWEKIFDNARNGGKSSILSVLDKKPDDYLAVKKQNDFLDSLSSKEVQAALATQASFEKFMREKGVSPQALPGMSAMYQVLSSAKGDQKAELEHLLPTVVRFLQDGKTILFDPKAAEGAYGMAMPGPYDKPQAVVITPAVIGADPIVVGKTLAHEFQHIYDMYTGRYYTLDSEMRGFKVAALYFEVLKKEHPDKYDELKNSLNDSTRSIIRDVEDYTADLHAGPQKFRDAVASRYTQRQEGVFFGRMSLRETVNPDFESSAVGDLAMARSRREKAQAEVADLEKKQAAIRAARDKTPSRDLDHQLEAATKDLAVWRSQFDHWDQDTTIKELRLRRMQSEAKWLDDRSKGAVGDPYDLTLPVDRTYVLP